MSRNKDMTPQDRELWLWVTRDVAPLTHKNQPDRPLFLKSLQPLKEPKSTQPIEIKNKKHNVQAKIDKRTTRNLVKGDLKIGAKLDLHGLTQAQAHKALQVFIQASVKKGIRVALLITGKGVSGEGVLKKQVPLWLENPDLSRFILNYAEARPQHGGSGALYILLKKLT